MRILYTFACLHLIINLSFTQKQNNIWYFGQNAGLDFNTINPTSLTSEMISIIGSASIADPNGQLLFYSNGITIWDRNHNIMPNGTFLAGGDHASQPVLIVPFPASGNQYFIFTAEDRSTPGSLRYSIIDMRLNGGFGDIIPSTKNTFVEDNTGDKITAILHSNGTDIWIITHRLNSNEFLSYLLTSSGLNTTPVVSAIGKVYPADGFGSPIKASHQGTKVVSACSLYDIAEIFDFNPSTGEFTNYFNLRELFDEDQDIEGIEFSPNDSILYLNSFVEGSFYDFLYQIELETMEVTILNSTPDIVFGALQLGPDHKIYKANPGQNTLGVINQPNKPGVSAQYDANGIILENGTLSLFGLPNPVLYSFFLDSNYFPSLGRDVSLCIGNSLILNANYPINCDSTTYLWNDGSTGNELILDQPGLYWLEINSNCGSFRDTIQVEFISCLPIVHYNLESCTAYMHNGTNMDYSEFTAFYPSQLTCTDVTAEFANRSPPQENKHSCTPGVGDSIAMCISSYNSCFYAAGRNESLIFEVMINPDVDSVVRITGIEFYQKAPINYNWINGGTGPNNYPTKYGIRILKNGSEIFRDEDKLTTLDWTLQKFDFINRDKFEVEDSTLFRIELLAYCPVGNNVAVSAWDIDEIKVFAGCKPIKNSKASITGFVKTNEGQAIAEVEIQLSSDPMFSGLSKKWTDTSGIYVFNLLEKGKSYFLKGFKNDDILNGVSTLDILQIQRHLLGITPFSSLLQYIAADVNNSGNITVIDLLELRKVLLGMYSEFPDNTSWRFGVLPQEMDFSSISQFREVADIEYLERDTQVINFVGIKAGDLNGDVDLLKQPKAIKPREAVQFTLEIDDQQVIAGVPYTVEIKANSEWNIFGIQFAIKLEGIDIIKLSGSKIPLTSENYSFTDGIFRLSWNTGEILNLAAGEVLFEMVLKSSSDGFLSNCIKLYGGAFNSEAYLENLKVVNLGLIIDNVRTKDTIFSYLNITPNPTNAKTKFHFYLEKEGVVEFLFYDITGRCIYGYQMKYSHGENEVEFNLDDFALNGLIICQITSNGYNLTRKIMYLN